MANVFVASNGDDFVVKQLDRSYKGALTEALKVDGKTGAVTAGGLTLSSGAASAASLTTTGAVAVGGALTVGGKTPITGTLFSVVSAGINASVTAGPVTIASLAIGDKLIAAANLTTPGDAQTAFETTVTVAGQLQQATTDLSAKQILFIFRRP